MKNEKYELRRSFVLLILGVFVIIIAGIIMSNYGARNGYLEGYIGDGNFYALHRMINTYLGMALILAGVIMVIHYGFKCYELYQEFYNPDGTKKGEEKTAACADADVKKEIPEATPGLIMAKKMVEDGVTSMETISFCAGFGRNVEAFKAAYKDCFDISL